MVILGVTAEERLPCDAHVHTLHHTPGVLPGLCHLVADLHLFGAADYCKREVDLPATEDRALPSPGGKDGPPLPPHARSSRRRLLGAREKAE